VNADSGEVMIHDGTSELQSHPCARKRMTCRVRISLPVPILLFSFDGRQGSSPKIMDSWVKTDVFVFQS